jgi:tetratricopeptide (TPR) repeat protein
MTGIIVFIFTFWSSVSSLTGKGNKLYRKDKYKEALEVYKKAQVKDPKQMKLDYNIGCAQYKIKSYNEALKSFTKIVSSLEDKKLKEKAIYNLGNAMFRLGNLKEAIEMYKQALKMNPTDLDAKINLEFAQKMLKESKKQQKKQKKDDQKNNQKKERKPKPKISPETAKNLLEALKEDEKRAKEKSQKQKRKRRKIVVKDW